MKDQGKDFLLREFSLENNIQLNASWMVTGCLLDQTPVRMLFDTGATKSYMSKSTWQIQICIKKLSLALLVKA